MKTRFMRDIRWLLSVHQAMWLNFHDAQVRFHEQMIRDSRKVPWSTVLIGGSIDGLFLVGAVWLTVAVLSALRYFL